MKADVSPSLGCMRIQALFLALVAFAIAGGCASVDEKTQKRTADLLHSFPPGTTRATVQARFGSDQPDISKVCPATGWASFYDRSIGEKCQNSERRTGKQVNRCDRYAWRSGMFDAGHYWFYYDDADRLTDAECESTSD